MFYSVNFITFPALKKFIIDPYYEKNKDKTSESLDSEEQSGKPLPEYVYHNGRMVHRSVLEAETLFNDDVKSESNDK